MENGSQMTLEQWMPEACPKQTVGASDSLARISASAENDLDLLGTAQACFSELCTFLDSSSKKKDPLSYSLRMLKICLVLMEDGISPDFSLKWIGSGMMQNGQFSTARIMESHRTERDCSLSDIIEKNVPATYYVSNRGGAVHNKSDENREDVHEIALCVTAKGQSNWTGSFIVQELPDGNKTIGEHI